MGTCQTLFSFTIQAVAVTFLKVIDQFAPKSTKAHKVAKPNRGLDQWEPMWLKLCDNTTQVGSLACVLLLLAVFWILLVHFFSAKSILPYFSSPRGVATSVPFPEVRSRKGTESGLGTPALMCWDLFPHLELPSGAKRPKIGSPIFWTKLTR